MIIYVIPESHIDFTHPDELTIDVDLADADEIENKASSHALAHGDEGWLLHSTDIISHLNYTHNSDEIIEYRDLVNEHGEEVVYALYEEYYQSLIQNSYTIFQSENDIVDNFLAQFDVSDTLYTYIDREMVLNDLQAEETHIDLDNGSVIVLT